MRPRVVVIWYRARATARRRSAESRTSSVGVTALPPSSATAPRLAADVATPLAERAFASADAFRKMASSWPGKQRPAHSSSTVIRKNQASSGVLRNPFSIVRSFARSGSSSGQSEAAETAAPEAPPSAAAAASGAAGWAVWVAVCAAAASGIAAERRQLTSTLLQWLSAGCVPTASPAAMSARARPLGRRVATSSAPPHHTNALARWAATCRALRASGWPMEGSRSASSTPASAAASLAWSIASRVSAGSLW
mmetsp:Transcript_4920/g.21056  ORF Transcript_4920/g.21056 Transcript_4920/m.21056 type:complete len:252 (+) Transcript_4920:1081-1836(+)